MDILVVGGGVFGLTAALELKARGHGVTVLDPGPLPHPLAASTDISKMMRVEYGSDVDYLRLGMAARDGWLRWNEAFDEPLYHETGMVVLAQRPLQPGDFGYDSYFLLRQHGFRPQRLDEAALAAQFPAWGNGRFVDGYFNQASGYVESGRVVAQLAQWAERDGVVLQGGQEVVAVEGNGGGETAVRTKADQTFRADHIVLAAGAWTPFLLPELADRMAATAHPVFHLQPADPNRFRPPRFPTFSADVVRTGYYGFPLHPREGVIKIARHGAGVHRHPSRDERAVSEEDVAHLRRFLADYLPALADAPLVGSHLCFYCDTPDEHFWIARHPHRQNLTVAAGGSGHAFKFAPVLGDLVADAVAGNANAYLEMFAWRAFGGQTSGQEATRHRPSEDL